MSEKLEDPKRYINQGDPRLEELLNSGQKNYYDPLFFEGSVLGYNDINHSIARLKENKSETLSVEGVSDIEEEIKTLSEQKDQMLRPDFLKILSKVFKILESNSPGVGPLQIYGIDRFRSMFFDEDIRNNLKPYFGENLENFTFTELLRKISDKTLPTSILHQAATLDIQNLKNKEKELREITKETKNEFKSSVELAVNNKRLPKSALDNLSKIDDVAVKIHDKFNDFLGTMVGGNHAKGKTIIISTFTLDQGIPAVKKILYHEFVHEISGKAYALKPNLENSTPEKLAYLQKHGLLFQDNYSWLNEAITESLALELFNEQDTSHEKENTYKCSNVYINERKELDRLLNSGLERDTVLEAYFENMYGDQTLDTRGIATAKLIRRINTIEGSSLAMKRLDNTHKMAELSKVLEDIGISLEEDLSDRDPLELEIRKKYIVEISLGKNRAQVKKRFTYLSLRLDLFEGVMHHIEQEWNACLTDLDEIKKQYGDQLNYTVLEQ